MGNTIYIFCNTNIKNYGGFVYENKNGFDPF